MKLKIWLVFVFSFSLFTNADSQNLILEKKIDSLEKKLIKISGIEKADVLNNLSQYYWSFSVEKSIEYAKEALIIAQKVNSRKGEAEAYNNLGAAFYYKGKYHESVSNLNNALGIYKEIENREREIATLNNLGMVFILLGSYDKALEYNFRSLKLSKESDDKEGIATSYYVIASVYSSLNNTEKAIEYNFLALNMFKKLNNKEYISSIYGVLGSVYYQEKDYRKALKYYFKSIEISKNQGTAWLIAQTFNDIALVYCKISNYDSAFFFAFKSLIIYQKFNSQKGIADVYINIANLHNLEKKFDSSLFYLNKGIELAEIVKDKSQLKEYYNMFSLLYEENKDYEKSLEFYKLYAAISDSIYTDLNNNRLTSLQIELETSTINAEKELQKLKAKRNMTQRNFLFLISLLILVLALIIFSMYNLKSKTNKLLGQKNNELELANNTKDKFFAIVAHDLRNHLTAFQAVTQSLSENYNRTDDDRKQHLITRLSNSSTSLYGLMENLLTWSLSQLNRMEYNPEIVELHFLAQETIEELQLFISRKNLQVINNISKSTIAFCDSNMISNVFRNITNNAIKFSKEGKSIILDSESSINQITIRIADEGVGISEEDISKLFRIDVDHTTIGTSQEQGTGLGLILCKEFIEKHGGSIWVKSEPGKGSQFFFTLKAYKSENNG